MLLCAFDIESFVKKALAFFLSKIPQRFKGMYMIQVQSGHTSIPCPGLPHLQFKWKVLKFITSGFIWYTKTYVHWILFFLLFGTLPKIF